MAKVISLETICYRNVHTPAAFYYRLTQWQVKVKVKVKVKVAAENLLQLQEMLWY
jgi:hypothetical protein